MRAVECTKLKVRHYVGVRQVRSLYSVYIATRQERVASKGKGSKVKDLLSGEVKYLTMSELLGLELKNPKTRKNLRLLGLRGGVTYIFEGRPKLNSCGVYIIPRSSRFKYRIGGKEAGEGTCVVYTGKEHYVLGVKEFRKMFIMQPNGIAAGAFLKGVVRGGGQQQPHIRVPQQPQARVQQQTQTIVQQPQVAKQQVTRPQQNRGSQGAYSQVEVNRTAVARLVRGETLLGLVLRDAEGLHNVDLATCKRLAGARQISNIKVVTRNGTTYLAGIQVSMEALPIQKI